MNELKHKLIAQHPILELIGNTPLLPIAKLEGLNDRVGVFGKAEWRNPGGSIKDRPVFSMLSAAIQEGLLKKGKTILDSSSGNAGIAYSYLGHLIGFPVKLVIPENVSRERKLRIQAHKAEIVFTDALAGYDEAIRTCHRIYEGNKDHYFFPNQYANRWNWQAHYDGTGQEILSQTKGEGTHFVAGVGTGGTITGVAKRLKEHNPQIKVIAVLPEAFPGIEGLKPLHSSDDIKPHILDESLIDSWIEVSSEDSAEFCQKLAKRGIFAGQSSGAYLAATHEVAKNLSSGVVVTIFSDIGERYMSTRLWDLQ